MRVEGQFREPIIEKVLRKGEENPEGLTEQEIGGIISYLDMSRKLRCFFDPSIEDLKLRLFLLLPQIYQDEHQEEMEFLKQTDESELKLATISEERFNQLDLLLNDFNEQLPALAEKIKELYQEKYGEVNVNIGLTPLTKLEWVLFVSVKNIRNEEIAIGFKIIQPALYSPEINGNQLILFKISQLAEEDKPSYKEVAYLDPNVDSFAEKITKNIF